MNIINSKFPVGVGLPSAAAGSIDKAWDNIFGDTAFQMPPRGLSYEIKSAEDAVIAEVEVPGVDPQEVKVKAEGRAIHVESPRGNAYFTIGARVNQEGITASIRHGLLTLRVPKREARAIEVQVECGE